MVDSSDVQMTSVRRPARFLLMITFCCLPSLLIFISDKLLQHGFVKHQATSPKFVFHRFVGTSHGCNRIGKPLIVPDRHGFLQLEKNHYAFSAFYDERINAVRIIGAKSVDGRNLSHCQLWFMHMEYVTIVDLKIEIHKDHNAKRYVVYFFFYD